MESRLLMLLVPRCYGFGTVLDFFRWLVSRRESSRPASRSTLRALEGELQGQEESSGAQKRERERGRVVLNSPIWTPPTGGWSNQSVCMGRSPTHVHGVYPRYTFSCDEKYTFTHVLKLLLGLHIYNITTFVILLIHTFLQPFIQV